MKQFVAVVHKDIGSAFGISFPDLPGCFSASDTLEELVPNAIEALELWAEDSVLPAPSSIETLHLAVKNDLAEGAFLVLVPFIERTGKATRINLSLDKGLLSAIDSYARERGLTRSSFLGDAARKVIEQRL